MAAGAGFALGGGHFAAAGGAGKETRAGAAIGIADWLAQPVGGARSGSRDGCGERSREPFRKRIGDTRRGANVVGKGAGGSDSVGEATADGPVKKSGDWRGAERAGEEQSGSGAGAGANDRLGRSALGSDIFGVQLVGGERAADCGGTRAAIAHSHGPRRSGPSRGHRL